jgi:hypothetical protein
MFKKVIQKSKIKLKDLHKQNSAIDVELEHEEKLYLESKQKMEKDISDEVKVENMKVNMLTYTPDISVLNDKDIQSLIKNI